MGPSKSRIFVAYGSLLALFAYPLIHLARYALANELHSHVLLIPVVSAYLAALRLRRKQWQPNGRISKGWVLFWALSSAAAAGVYLSSMRWGRPVSGDDCLTFGVMGFVGGTIAMSLALFGSETMHAVAFPLGFLFCMVPIPAPLLDPFQEFLQHRSAEVVSGLFWLTGIPALREGTVFRLPNISIEVAQECSGIHSTLVLLLCTLIAGHVFLKGPWHRALLVLAAIPLGVLRNAFRIWVIATLCVSFGPQWIDSPVHRRGGPLFFLLSLVLLGLLVAWLRHREVRGMMPGETKPPAPFS